ncbi:type I restriction endonuclease subunit R [Corynebacterium phocae]|nr:type I restriction endonuclease subunit R [Corynebacterium phocae]
MERAFEESICEALLESGWVYEPEKKTEGWDKQRALYLPDVEYWLKSQFPKEWEKAVPEGISETKRQVLTSKLYDRLVQMLDKDPVLDARTGEINQGLLGVLRKGFSFAQRGATKSKFDKMVEFAPENPLYTDVLEKSKNNRLRVLRQVPFDLKSTETIDLVLLVNGIPVVTMELKTDNTQTVWDAVKQYKKDRKPSKVNRPLLVPGRCLVHFAVSNQQVYMSTALQGADTFFLPFNKGNEGRAGNPENPEGSDTAYLWNEIFQPDLFLRILRDYALWEPAAKGNQGRLIFPRYHQLRATEKVVNDVYANGVGSKYLIQHSAGSGKTKTIAWLAHRLQRLMDAEGKSVFDSVIVITDRTVLDDNVREGLSLLRASEGLVVNVDQSMGAKSAMLNEALVEGGHIISCTLQTFPALAKAIERNKSAKGRNYCVIIDEAHSSQHGQSSNQLRKLLTDIEVDEDAGVDEFLEAMETGVAIAKNMSFVALTATPKAKTLMAYGVESEDGDHMVAFDTYEMSQAIEENFILDVLKNYSTFQMFARIRDELGRTEEVRKGEAVSYLTKYTRLHPTSIAQKVKITVDHFRRNVQHLLNGTAKAMVVAADRKSAYEWYRQMSKYIDEQGYQDMEILVAYSGSLDIGDEDGLTEKQVNNVRDVAEEFRGNDVRKMLIVANKFQTGFDEPRLCAMYVDRKLGGVQAVQTLSRLNRVAEGKPNPMVLDFVNDSESILKAFQLYYRDAFIAGDIPANTLDDLAVKLDAAGFYTPEDLEKVAELFVKSAPSEKLQAALSPVRHRWNDHMQTARLKGDDKAYNLGRDFTANLRKYANAWEFLSQIIDYQDAHMHKRAILAELLARNLHADRLNDEEDYETGVTLVGVAIAAEIEDADLGLAGSEDNGELEIPGFDGSMVGENSPVVAAFEEAVKEVNDILSIAGLGASNHATRAAIRASYGVLIEDERVKQLAKENGAASMATSAEFKQKSISAIVKAAKESETVYKAIMANTDNTESIVKALAYLVEAAEMEAVQG